MLRDGSEVLDPRTDRIPFHDPRSRGYGVTSLIEDYDRLRSYTWRVPSPQLDQGAEGACVGFGWTHELLARPLQVKLPMNGQKFAREIVYWGAQRIDEWPGGAYPGARPFYEGTSVLAGAKILQDLGYFKEYRWCFSEEELAYTVAWRGPVVLGIPWYEGMYRPDRHGYLNPTGRKVGYHCLLDQGFKNKTQRSNEEFHRVWNSWNNFGPAKISREVMRELLKDWGEMCVPIGRSRV